VNILSARKFLTLTPFDVTTEQGRSDERYRLAVLSMGANLLSRGVAMFVMVLSVSLTIPYLGVERFGVWMTIASFAGMLSFLDLGVGNALTNKVTQVATKNDADALRRAISGGLGTLLIIGCITGFILFSLTTILPWHKIIKIKEMVVENEIQNATGLFAILFGFSLFSNGLQRVFAGLQKAYISHFINLIGSVFSLFALWLATKLEADIPHLLLATLGVQLFVNLLLLAILINRRLFTTQQLATNTNFESRNLLNTGGLFFILQIGTMVGWGADSLIIASTLGATQVALFNIVQRLFQFISQPLSIMNNPLWGSYADAHARGDKKFIKKTLRKSLLATLFFSSIGGSVLLIFNKEFIDLWTGNNITVPFLFVLTFFFWTIIEALGNAFSMMLNGCGIIREQVITVVTLTIIALPIKLIAVNYSGITEMQASYAFIYCISVLFFYGYFFRKNLKDKIGL
jgi:O-antigen/teichoic acid export membrane protein